MLFGHLAFIVGRDITVMQASSGKLTYYNYPTISTIYTECAEEKKEVLVSGKYKSYV